MVSPKAIENMYAAAKAEHELKKAKETTAKQIDGDHYVKMGIQPWEIIEKNDLDYWEGAALKYLLRWRKKDGMIDLDKVIHYIEHIKALAKKGHYGEQFKEAA